MTKHLLKKVAALGLIFLSGCTVNNTQNQAIGSAVGIAYGLGISSDIKAQLETQNITEEVEDVVLLLKPQDGSGVD